MNILEAILSDPNIDPAFKRQFMTEAERVKQHMQDRYSGFPVIEAPTQALGRAEVKAKARRFLEHAEPPTGFGSLATEQA